MLDIRLLEISHLFLHEFEVIDTQSKHVGFYFLFIGNRVGIEIYLDLDLVFLILIPLLLFDCFDSVLDLVSWVHDFKVFKHLFHHLIVFCVLGFSWFLNFRLFRLILTLFNFFVVFLLFWFRLILGLALLLLLSFLLPFLFFRDFLFVLLPHFLPLLLLPFLLLFQSLLFFCLQLLHLTIVVLGLGEEKHKHTFKADYELGKGEISRVWWWLFEEQSNFVPISE